ncbi:hypothetical protein TcCL_NonESM13657 [Trypanosoma cruzi]|nr:hypothetical protein TcCL_NonESM13657 [Trypanosoma cruzi]
MCLPSPRALPGPLWQKKHELNAGHFSQQRQDAARECGHRIMRNNSPSCLKCRTWGTLILRGISPLTPRWGKNAGSGTYSSLKKIKGVSPDPFRLVWMRVCESIVDRRLVSHVHTNKQQQK